MTLPKPRLREWIVLAAGLGLVGAPTQLTAQQTVLTLSGWPLTVTSTTGGDFEVGAVSLGSTTFSVDATTNVPAKSPRSTTVQVQCVPACPRSGTLPLAGLQWRRSDQAAWTTLTTAYADIETRTVTFNGLNDPWSQTVLWRYALSWTANPPTAASQFRLRFRLVVAAP